MDVAAHRERGIGVTQLRRDVGGRDALLGEVTSRGVTAGVYGFDLRNPGMPHGALPDAPQAGRVALPAARPSSSREPADGFESERIAWVALSDLRSLIDKGEITSGTTLAALLYV
jgi:hypothetical protein